MTFDQCNAALSAIRRRQGTSNPKIRVALASGAFSGRVARADCDPEQRKTVQGPYGILVLEHLGLSRFPQTILQIADIPDNGIKPIEEA